MEEIGEFLGTLIIVFYALAVSRYFFKWIYKLFKTQLEKNDGVNILFKKVMRIFMKYHGVFGVLTVLAVLAHFFVQFTSKGLSITGLIAASAMTFQVLLGVYGTKVKNKWRYWSLIHRILATVILVMILIHVI